MDQYEAILNAETIDIFNYVTGKVALSVANSCIQTMLSFTPDACLAAGGPA